VYNEIKYVSKVSCKSYIFHMIYLIRMNNELVRAMLMDFQIYINQWYIYDLPWLDGNFKWNEFKLSIIELLLSIMMMQNYFITLINILYTNYYLLLQKWVIKFFTKILLQKKIITKVDNFCSTKIKCHERKSTQ
jgi:hypothetical protein